MSRIKICQPTVGLVILLFNPATAQPRMTQTISQGYNFIATVVDSITELPIQNAIIEGYGYIDIDCGPPAGHTGHLFSIHCTTNLEGVCSCVRLVDVACWRQQRSQLYVRACAEGYECSDWVLVSCEPVFCINPPCPFICEKTLRLSEAATDNEPHSWGRIKAIYR